MSTHFENKADASSQQGSSSKLCNETVKSPQKASSQDELVFRAIFEINPTTVSDKGFMRKVINIIKKAFRSGATSKSVLTAKLLDSISPNLRVLRVDRKTVIGSYPIDIAINVIGPYLSRKNENSDFFKGHELFDELSSILWNGSEDLQLADASILTPGMERIDREDIIVSEADREKALRAEIDRKREERREKVSYSKRSQPAVPKYTSSRSTGVGNSRD